MPSGAVRPEAFGARGDNATDDTKALQAAMDATPPGGTLWLTGTYRHSDVLRVRAAGSTIDGGGTLLATNQERSALWLDADRLTVRNLTARLDVKAGDRFYAYEQMKIRSSHRSQLTLEHILVDGSAAAGVFLEGVDGFTANDIVIRDTRADGFHMTGGSANGNVSGVSVDNSGDDGVAVVSYWRDPAACHDITVSNSLVANQRWGRGFSVVGGERVTFNGITGTQTSGAGLYIASEDHPYYTRPTTQVRADNVRFNYANANWAVSHGAVLIYSAGQSHDVADVQVTNLHASNTGAQSGRVVGVLGPDSQIGSVSVDTRDCNPPSGADAYRRLRY